MNRMQLEILTPIHISSGNEIQANFEYLYFPDEKVIAVLSPEKVLDILGEENLSHWISCIDKGESLLNLLRKRKSLLVSSDVALRFLKSTGIEENKPIKEQIHLSTTGFPIIPGSSIKGAIRTAIFASLMLDNDRLAKDPKNIRCSDGKRIRWSDEGLKKILLGRDPNSDIFRLLRVGDVCFENVSTFTQKVLSINKYGNSYKIKRELTQYVEAIPSKTSATGVIEFNSLLESRSGSLFNKYVSKIRLEYLPTNINSHTKRLLEDEIEYWESTAGNPEELENFTDELKRVYDIAIACQRNEFVVRIGWGSGFRFMTGDWHGLMTDEDYDTLLKSLRPKHPVNLIFPKSMRFIAGGIPLGFAKIKIDL